jgi:hypothetical protein
MHRHASLAIPARLRRTRDCAAVRSLLASGRALPRGPDERVDVRRSRRVPRRVVGLPRRRLACRAQPREPVAMAAGLRWDRARRHGRPGTPLAAGSTLARRGSPRTRKRVCTGPVERSRGGGRRDRRAGDQGQGWRCRVERPGLGIARRRDRGRAAAACERDDGRRRRGLGRRALRARGGSAGGQRGAVGRHRLGRPRRRCRRGDRRHGRPRRRRCHCRHLHADRRQRPATDWRYGATARGFRCPRRPCRRSGRPMPVRCPP